MENVVDITVEVVKDFRYLGMTIINDGMMEKEVRAIIEAASKNYHSALNLLRKISISEKKTNLKIHNSIIRPILLDGCALWVLTKVLEKRVEVFEEMVLQKITGPMFHNERCEWS